MHILHTVLYTFPKVLTRRICLLIRSFFCWASFSSFSWPQYMVQGLYCKEKLDASHSKGLKGYYTSNSKVCMETVPVTRYTDIVYLTFLCLVTFIISHCNHFNFLVDIIIQIIFFLFNWIFMKLKFSFLYIDQLDPLFWPLFLSA